MLDQDELTKQYKVAVRACFGIALIPFLLVFIAWNMGAPSDAPDMSDATVILAVFGLVALSPLVSVPLFRMYLRRISRTTAERPDPEAVISTFAITEFALWELSSLIGFVAYIQTGLVWFFAATVTLTYIGYAISFPRLSNWRQRANEQAAGGPANTIIST